MQLIKDAIYDLKPENVMVCPTSVMVIKSCEEVQFEDKIFGITATKFKCDVEVYEVHEYIDKLRIENANLDAQLTQTQVGLVEVYETILGGEV